MKCYYCPHCNDTCYKSCPFLKCDGEWICLLTGEEPVNMDIIVEECPQYISYRAYRDAQDD